MCGGLLNICCRPDKFWIAKSDSAWKFISDRYPCGFLPQMFCKLLRIDSSATLVNKSFIVSLSRTVETLHDFAIRSPAYSCKFMLASCMFGRKVASSLALPWLAAYF